MYKYICIQLKKKMYYFLIKEQVKVIGKSLKAVLLNTFTHYLRVIYLNKYLKSVNFPYD